MEMPPPPTIRSPIIRSVRGEAAGRIRHFLELTSNRLEGILGDIRLFLIPHGDASGHRQSFEEG
jgi:hypothetical protein